MAGSSLSLPPAGDTLRGLAAPLVAAAAALAVILPTTMRTVAYWDTGEFQAVLPLMGTAHSPGYPTYVILGWFVNLLLSPVGEPAFRVNVFSGLCVAAAAALVVVLVRRLTGNAIVGVAAGVGLALSPLAWRLGAHAEPHTLHLAFVALLLVLLATWEAASRRGDAGADRWLVAAAVTFGLADGNHSLTLLLAPAIGAYVLVVHPGILRRPRLIAACLIAAIGTLALVYMELPIRAGILRAPLVYGTPDTWDGFWYIFLAQQFQGAVSSPLADLGAKATALVKLGNEQLGVLTLLLPAAFIVTVGRYPRFALLTGLAALITCLFSASYANADISRYYLGPLLIAWVWLAILAAMVVDVVLDRVGTPARRPTGPSGAATPEDSPAGEPNASEDQRRPTSGPEALPAAPGRLRPRGAGPIAIVLSAVLAGLLVAPTALAIPDRSRQLDESDDPGATIWLDAALDRIAENAVVVSWWSYSTPLWYETLVNGRRSDLTVIDDRTMLDQRLGEAVDVVARYYGQRPVYVIRLNDHDLGLIKARFILEPGTGPAANVYEVTGIVKRAS